MAAPPASADEQESKGIGSDGVLEDFSLRDELKSRAMGACTSLFHWRALFPQQASDGTVVDVHGDAYSRAEALMQFGDWRVENGDEWFFDVDFWESVIGEISLHQIWSDAAVDRIIDFVFSAERGGRGDGRHLMVYQDSAMLTSGPKTKSAKKD